jgi:hypothetical protein
MYMIEVALVANRKFNFSAVGKYGENKVGAVTMIVFQEHWFTQKSDKRLTIRKEVFVCVISNNQPEIKVGVDISYAPGIRATDKSGYHPIIGIASFYKVIHYDLMVKRHLSFLRVHGFVPPFEMYLRSLLTFFLAQLSMPFLSRLSQDHHASSKCRPTCHTTQKCHHRLS